MRELYSCLPNAQERVNPFADSPRINQLKYPSCMESHLMEASMIAKLKLQVNTKKFDKSASQNTN
jgi:hypothetical protein